MLDPCSLLVSALFYVSLITPSYTILILLILALFPFVSTSVSDLVTCSRTQREDLVSPRPWVMLRLPHSSSLNLPQSRPDPNAFLTLTSTHSYPSTNPTLAPDCQVQLLKVREAKIVSALSIPHPPLNCLQKRGGAESPVLERGSTEGEEALLRSRDAKQQHGNSPIGIAEAICRDSQHKLSSEHHKTETPPFCNFMLLISSHLKPSIFSLLSRALWSVLRGKLE